MVYGDDNRACKHCIERGGLLDNFGELRFVPGFAQITLWISNSLSTSCFAGMALVVANCVVFQNFFLTIQKILKTASRRFRAGFGGRLFAFAVYLFT